MYLQDAAFLNLRMAADLILGKGDSVVAVGLDDTTKAAGHRMYDIKTDHITIINPDKQRITVTTGYTENASHSGSDGAESYRFRLKCLAALADVTVDDILQSIDFFMTDRAGDNATLLENLDVANHKIIKCSAHVILGVDHAVDKVFRNAEQKIGIHKLLNLSAGEKAFCSPSTSVHTLGQIAIAKLLSPSHAATSVSLYNEYKQWLDAKNELGGFCGFISNRFGRIANISKQFIEQKRLIMQFFSDVVDINSNKLVLAVSTYIQNDWFHLCVEIYAEIGDVLIFPIMDLLGVDDRKLTTDDERSWNGVRTFFETKIPELRNLKTEKSQSTLGKDLLFGAILEEVLDTLDRQLSEMDFFKDPDIDCEKLNLAPLTNLGCESEFAKFDNRVKICGGSTSVTTLSRKNVVMTNGLLRDSSYTELACTDKRKKWKWARTSNEVKQARKLEKDFIATVQAAKRLSIVKKEELKKLKNSKTMKVLDDCKKHGGPVTQSDIEILDSLSESQLLNEISYLRLTVAPNIRQKRRVKLENGQFRMQKFTPEELRISIKNVLKPVNEIVEDIDSLLKCVLTVE
jgi:hypothetical protein